MRLNGNSLRGQVQPRSLEETTRDLPIHLNMQKITRHLGYEVITVFSRLYLNGGGGKEIEFIVKFTKYNKGKNYQDFEDYLENLNKYKRIHFWHKTTIRLNAGGLNTIMNCSTDRETKKMKLVLLNQLGAENFGRLIEYVNRKIDKEVMYNDSPYLY